MYFIVIIDCDFNFIGNKENATNVSDVTIKFDANKSPKHCSAWIKNRRLRNNCQHVTSTVSLDAFSFPIDNKNLERVKTSPNLLGSDVNCQKSDISNDVDIMRRERIERYKEERRIALRERFKSTEINPYDDEIIKRLRAKTLKSPDECTDDSSTNLYSKQPNRLVKITTYNERDDMSSDSGQKEWYTQSLERQKFNKNKSKGLVACRVNQLIESTTTSDVINDQNTTIKTITDKPISR